MKLTREQVERRITNILVEQLGIGETEVKPTSALVDDLGADSLDCVEILMAVEEEFDIEVSDPDAAEVETVQQAIDLVAPRVS